MLTFLISAVASLLFLFLIGPLLLVYNKKMAHSRNGAASLTAAEQFNPEEESDSIPYRPPRYSPEEMVYRSQQFLQIMSQRRSCRHFSPDPVPREVVLNAVRTALISPSGANRQPWTFLLIENPNIKRQLRQIIEEEEECNYRRRMGEEWLKDLEPFKVNWVKEYLDVAPYILVVMKLSHDVDEQGQKITTYYTDISVSIAVGILLSALQNAGLVTVTSTPMNAGPAIRHVLGRPSNEKVLLVLPIGYPHQDAQVPNIKRKPFIETVAIYE